ncbi:hypothetical protein KUCAC02_018205 [Chaenocephalus aceratus]|uniref:Uncharacterized protein n=1 Tax=Chaenocephalus aceratus TaxID=36190 RepID=A0ACB9W8G8_CHAAC|nr:hypothetical protein KUCAC02_018205 [Chaenocephalus aceratus]
MAEPPSTAFASAYTSRSELLSEPPPTASVSNLQLLPQPADSYSHLKTTTAGSGRLQMKIPTESCGRTSAYSLYKETCTDVILLPCGDLSLVGLPDQEMLPPPYRARSPPFLLIARTKNAPPHLCNHQHFLRMPIH